MSAQEFQAVLLAAGRGSRMTELSVARPKCLMPVGPHPVLYHSLLLLQKAGFKEAIVVVLSSAQSVIQSTMSGTNLDITIQYVGIPSDEDWGTADSLRHLYNEDLIKSDVVVVSADVFTNTELTELFLKFRQHDASLVTLFFTQFDHSVVTETPPGAKSKLKPEKDIVGLDEESSRLVLLASASDFEDTVPFKRSILRRHLRLSLRTDLLDSHIYAISHNLIKYLALSSSFSTLKGEFLPYVVSKQHCRIPESNVPVADDKFRLLSEIVKNSENDEYVRDVSTYHDHRGDLKNIYHGDNMRCYAVLANSSAFGIRINSVLSLWLANRLVVSTEQSSTGPRVDPTANVQTNQIEDTFVGSGTILSEKTSIRGSVIAENCIIQSRTRITKSIILPKVEVKEGCVIENCIIGNDVKIGEKCELKNCLIGANLEVASGTNSSFHVLIRDSDYSARLMEI